MFLHTMPHIAEACIDIATPTLNLGNNDRNAAAVENSAWLSKTQDEQIIYQGLWDYFALQIHSYCFMLITR